MNIEFILFSIRSLGGRLLRGRGYPPEGQKPTLYFSNPSLIKSTKHYLHLNHLTKHCFGTSHQSKNKLGVAQVSFGVRKTVHVLNVIGAK